MPSPKILLVANNFPPIRGGSASVYASIARCAAPQIAVLAPQINYNDGTELPGWREYDQAAPYPIARLKLLRTALPSTPPKGCAKFAFTLTDLVIRARMIAWIAAFLIKYRPRTVCVGELLASRWLINLLRLVPNLKIVAYVHGEEITTADPYDPKATRRREALEAADRIIVVSRFTRDAVLALLGSLALPKIALIENGLDTALFRPTQRRPDLVARYGLQDQFVFVSVCRLLEKKGIDHALGAFAKILETHPDSRFLVVGSGPFEPHLRDLAKTLGIVAKVIFAGSVPDDALAAHYALGDVFVMPNRALPNGDTEGFGLVFLEANGCGLPVIAGRDGGSGDAVRNGDNGLVVDGKSIEEITEAMQRLRENPQLRADLAANGQDAAKAADWSHKAQAFMEVCGV